MIARRRERAVVAACAVVFGAVVMACGGSDSGSAAPPAGAAGTGGAGAAPGSEKGPCYGNGTCNAGLTCLSGVCVNAGSTGGAGGTSAAGGAAGTGASAGGTGGTAAGGAAGASPQGGAAGVGQAGGAGWGNPGPGDDPCPDHIDVNCSDSCGPMSPECTAPTTTCHMMAGVANDAVIHVAPSSGKVFTLRTPSHPGVDQHCKDLCGISGLAFGLQVVVASSAFGPYFTATASPPWGAAPGVDFDGYCTASGPCVADQPGYSIYFSTSDPAAPARNVLVTFSDTQGSCP